MRNDNHEKTLNNFFKYLIIATVLVSAILFLIISFLL